MLIKLNWNLRRFGATLIALVAGCASSAVPAAAQSVADFYRGKQIILMVGSSPGGGYDAIARLVARHLVNHIPGNPNIVVQNTPGGGSLTMTNRIYRVAPQDGTVMGLVQRGVLLAQLTKQPNVQFEVSKLNWIGSVSPEQSLVVAWNTAPVKTVQDLLATQLIVGGTGATSDLEASARLLNATIGTKFKIVSGYPGQADVSLAMERGEIQGTADWSWSEIKTRHADLLEAKKINLLLQNALRKAPDLPDVPLAMDLIKDDTDRRMGDLYFGVKEIARPILAAPGVPADRLAALRAAFMMLKGDADFRMDAQAVGIEVDPTPASNIDAYVKLTASASPEVVRRLTEILNPKK
ncbi:MAG TPA: tripartite tricarboxylate transporter substrate-binding protein [Xanthobacteraceae bacterium]